MIAQMKAASQVREATLPATFMINEEGVIIDLHRAQKPDDYVPFERVEAFIPEEKRCKCNKQNCISPRCRETYEIIKRESDMMIREICHDKTSEASS